MVVSVRARGIKWNKRLEDRVARSVGFAADRYKDHVSHISVYLTDVNGPKGGVDKLCQMTATLRTGRRVLILEKGDELISLVDRTAGHLAYRIARSIRLVRHLPAQQARPSIRYMAAG